MLILNLENKESKDTRDIDNVNDKNSVNFRSTLFNFNDLIENEYMTNRIEEVKFEEDFYIGNKENLAKMRQSVCIYNFRDINKRACTFAEFGADMPSDLK